MSGCMNASMSVSLALNMGSDDSQLVTISDVFHYCMGIFLSYNFVTPYSGWGKKTFGQAVSENHSSSAGSSVPRCCEIEFSLLGGLGQLQSELEMYLLSSQHLVASFCRATRSDQQDLLVSVLVDVHNNFFIHIVVEKVDRR